MRAFRAVAAGLLGAVVLCGCDSGGSDTPGASRSAPAATALTASATGPTTSAPATSGPTAPASPAASTTATGSSTPTSAAERLVTVTRTGGFAGKTNSLLIKGDGSWTRLDGKAEPVGSGKLSPDELDRLRDALRAADFAHLPRVSKSGTVYDGFTYTFVHSGFEVVTADGSIPPGLQDVLTALPSFDG